MNVTLLSDEQITTAREQNGVQKLICITIDRTVDAFARLTGGRTLDLMNFEPCIILKFFLKFQLFCA